VKQYLMSIYMPDEGTPSPEFLDKVMSELEVLNEDMKAAGAWVFTGGLHAASTATVVRVRGGDVLMTDGPYAEGKEHVGGLWIINAPDLDGALDWARRAAAATTLPIEVRPFSGEG
jgi:hypothetical protein